MESIRRDIICNMFILNQFMVTVSKKDFTIKYAHDTVETPFVLNNNLHNF